MEKLARRYAGTLHELYCEYQDSLPDFKSLVDPRNENLASQYDFKKITETTAGLLSISAEIADEFNESGFRGFEYDSSRPLHATGENVIRIARKLKEYTAKVDFSIISSMFRLYPIQFA